MKPINLAVNVSGRQFSQPHFARTVHALLASFDWPAERLELEITENWAMRQPEASAAIMQSLHQSGIRFALDDFGTGYSSLSHLRLYPIDTIKIDRTFISQLGIEPDSETLVQSVIALARSLGMRCVAEGVETATQVDFLQALGCHAVQGYLQAEPMPAEKFCAWAADHS